MAPKKKKRKSYRGHDPRSEAADSLRILRRSQQYVEQRLQDGDCVGALYGVVDMGRNAGIAAAFTYSSKVRKGRMTRRDPATRVVGRMTDKIAKECGLPRNWKQWRK